MILPLDGFKSILESLLIIKLLYVSPVILLPALVELPNTNGIFLGIVTYFPANKLILFDNCFVNVPDEPDVTDKFPLVNVK